MSSLETTRTLEIEEDRVILSRTWESPPGLYGWFIDTNHRAIGKRFIVTAFVFFLLAGIEALVMRIQLARPESNVLNPDLYNQFFTMHGTTMMFLFAVPMMEGLGIYFVPLMIGTRDLAFPRLNAFGYYVYLLAGVTLYLSFLLSLAPDAGWFSYVPLAGPVYSPGMRIDVWAMAITFLELSALVAAVEIIITVFKQRAPGMSLDRIPLFVWAQLVMSFMILFAMPPLMTGSLYLEADRSVGTHFYNPAGESDPLLWQHIFWFFGHPEVYIIFLPATGLVSTIVISAARRHVFGYLAIVLALVATGFVSFGLWVHHMFATGLPRLGTSFFTAASVLIAIPSGVQVFCWIATLWGSKPLLRTPLLFVIGFFVTFVAGGLTGVMIASVPFDLQVHDTFFIVAHFHYVLIGGAVFPLLGALFYWFPKITGRMMSERAGKWSFWLIFVGFNVVFFPMHILGLVGMPRRIYTYVAEVGWGPLNLLATAGVFLLAVGVAVFVLNALHSLRNGDPAGADPWRADTLEWATTSPPENFNFQHIPVVRGRYALWDRKPRDPVVSGLSLDRREVLLTRTLDAEPEGRSVLSLPSIWPLLLALAVGVGFIGYIFDEIFLPIGFVLSFLALLGWHWPERREERGA